MRVEYVGPLVCLFKSDLENSLPFFANRACQGKSLTIFQKKALRFLFYFNFCFNGVIKDRVCS